MVFPGFLVGSCLCSEKLSRLGKALRFSLPLFLPMERGEQEQGVMCLVGKHSAGFWQAADPHFSVQDIE